MKPFFLQFPDAATAKKALGEWMPKEGAYASAPEWAVHIVADIYTRAVMDGTKVVTPATKKPGYYVNVLAGKLPDALQPYAVDPVTPDFIFAGYPVERPAKGWASIDGEGDALQVTQGKA